MKVRWIKKRHQIVRTMVGWIIWLLCKVFYRGIIMERFPEGDKEPYLILYNHQTGFDQFFVSLCVKRPVYHVATEDIFSNGFSSRLIEFLVAPIPIRKQVTDLDAVKNCVRIAREGGTIAIAPEGNRTYDGRTAYINPAVVKLAKLMKLPIAIFRIEGGYGVHPRWSDSRRRGPMKTGVTRVIRPEEYLKMDNDSLIGIIRDSLYTDESQPGETYTGERRAEYLERLFYVCPECGLSEFESVGSRITCRKCGISAEYAENKELLGDGRFPYSTVGEWYDAQKNYILRNDLAKEDSSPLYSESVSVYDVVLYDRKKRIIKNGRICLYPDRIVIYDEKDDMFVSMLFSETDIVTLLGKNKCNIYYKEKVYQIKGSKRFNALKYVNLFYVYRIKEGGTQDVEFLGL